MHLNMNASEHLFLNHKTECLEINTNTKCKGKRKNKAKCLTLNR